MGDIVTPPGIASGRPPDFAGASVVNSKEWWDGWLSGSQEIITYIVVRTEKVPCPQPTGVGDAQVPTKYKETEIRQNQKSRILTYTISKYKLETSWLFYLGVTLAVIGGILLVVATGGVAAGAIGGVLAKVAISAAAAGTLLGIGGCLASLGGVLVSIKSGAERGSYLGTGIATVTTDPVDDGTQYSVVTKGC